MDNEKNIFLLKVVSLILLEIIYYGNNNSSSSCKKYDVKEKKNMKANGEPFLQDMKLAATN